MIDWDHAHRLLNIANLARQWPDLKWLHDEAMKELAAGKPQPKAEIRTTPVEVPDPPSEDPEGGAGTEPGAAEDTSGPDIKRRTLDG